MTSKKEASRPPLGLLSLIGPGLLVAATGVGAGDLATASFAGHALGTACLWAVVVGGFLKFVLTEGLTRWQLATGQSLLEGVAQHFGRVAGILFLPYLLLWTFFVGAALMNACGVALHTLLPVFENPVTGKICFGILASGLGLILVLIGGFRLFEKIMTLAIGLMFATVLVTAARLWPGTQEVLRGLVIPRIPHAEGDGVTWTLALMGGVGGTLTILCYGYWIREKGRVHPDAIGICRIDLGAAYVATILFGLAMVIIGSTVSLEGRGTDLLMALADQLEDTLGPATRWLFLIGAFCALFSSLLGVWQAVPYLFADFWRLFFTRERAQDQSRPITQSTPYRLYLFLIATVPAIGLWMRFKEIQKVYSIIGALFIPMLAASLLILNGRRAWVGSSINRKPTQLVLGTTLVFFGYLAYLNWKKLFP